MSETIVVVLLVIGSFFIFVASLGLLRLPDLYMRMSCSTKAGTIGLGALLLALALYFSSLGVICRALATIGFVFLTAPVASHLLGRTAYIKGAALWQGTVKDELKRAAYLNAND
ncbi:MAG: monovalent cation/H(+) antiporter subunit G [Desulfobacterales bacterium]|nr:monovalent cation/H(+) antiporter subunit G [Desulfobacterales bacterium]